MALKSSQMAPWRWNARIDAAQTTTMMTKIFAIIAQRSSMRSPAHVSFVKIRVSSAPLSRRMQLTSVVMHQGVHLMRGLVATIVARGVGRRL